MKRRLIIAGVTILGLALAAGGAWQWRQQRAGPYPGQLPLVPRPVHDEIRRGAFRLSAATRFVVTDATQRENADTFNTVLRDCFGFTLAIDTGATARRRNTIRLETGPLPGQPEGAYRLEVTPRGVHIRGSAESVWHGLQTFRQLMRPAPAAVVRVQCAVVDDYPRYPWRGMHLDVSRHFFGVPDVKRYLDHLSAYKFNRFHWHLTDDQGWRLAITNYPRLTSVGGARTGTLIGHSRKPAEEQTYREQEHGGFYTQEEARAIVEYARRRHITVVPEIEMPGHSLAALAAYPELSCTGGPFEVARTWEQFDDLFCNKDAVFDVLTNVLDEVIAIFPGRYIHAGGDECATRRWESCGACQAVRRREGLPDTASLHGYFLGRIGRHLQSRGRTLAGWCEMTAGTLPADALVMAWRGVQGGIAAARLGHPVVMTPTEYCYFDHYQDHAAHEPLAIGGFTPLYKVYSFDPTPAELAGTASAQHVLGGQGNVWTEYMPDWDTLEYMVFPRICAMAEALWTPPARKDLMDFGHRLADEHFAWLDRMGVNYHQSLFNVRVEQRARPDGGGVEVLLTNRFMTHPIHYTLDGTEPSPASARFRRPLTVTANTQLRARMFVGGKPKGREVLQELAVR